MLPLLPLVALRRVVRHLSRRDAARLVGTCRELWHARADVLLYCGSPCLRRTLRGHYGRVWSVAWSPDGTRLASASDDRTARVWDAATGQPIHMLRGHTGSVMSVAWAPDGTRLASASYDGTMSVWDVPCCTH